MFATYRTWIAEGSRSTEMFSPLSNRSPGMYMQKHIPHSRDQHWGCWGKWDPVPTGRRPESYAGDTCRKVARAGGGLEQGDSCGDDTWIDLGYVFEDKPESLMESVREFQEREGSSLTSRLGA